MKEKEEIGKEIGIEKNPEIGKGIDIEHIRKIERRRKYRYRYTGMLRERNVCPNCNSLDIAKRSTTHDYKCYNCKWVGVDIKKIMV